MNRPPSPPSNRALLLVSAVLALQALGFYLLPEEAGVVLRRPLSAMPTVVGEWKLLQEGVVEEEVMQVLKADDVISRLYVEPQGNQTADLFVAYFKSQRRGVTPHSPKNCLPGSGWMPVRSDKLLVQVPGRRQPIETNRYVVAKGQDTSYVLYWYQTHDRVVASEYAARVFLVWDALRYRRSSTAIVRVTVPISGQPEAVAHQAAVAFVQSVFGPLTAALTDIQPARQRASLLAPAPGSM